VALTPYLAVRLAPDFHAALGASAGVGLTLLIIAAINAFALAWLISNLAFGTVGVGALRR
jgi:hypothetical protein